VNRQSLSKNNNKKAPPPSKADDDIKKQLWNHLKHVVEL